MPTISMFFGITIEMYYDEHNPPHFHAKYQGNKAIFDLEGNFIDGNLPHKQIKFVSVWADIHKEELLKNWELARLEQQLNKIDPLR